ncbi:MAG: outer membrane protein [Devosia sp.]
MNRITITLLAGVATLGFASASQAADLIVNTAPVVAPVVSTGGNWDGAYIGAFAGYGWGTLSDETDTPFLGLPDDELDVNGWKVGIAAGADFTVSEAIVAGIVADIAWDNASGEDTTAGFTYDVNWSGSVRGRLGFDGGAFLPYVTAGLAFANATADDGTETADATHIGWTAGAGVEFAVADNVSLDLQYRFTDYGTQTYALTGGDADLSLTSNAVTAGVNFRF